MKLTGPALERALKAPDRAWRGVLTFGPNRARAEEAVARLCAWWLGEAAGDPYAVTRLNEDELRKDRARLADELVAAPLFGPGGPRVVRVRAEGDAAAEPIVAALMGLEAGQPAAALLLVEAGDLPARSKIRVAFESAQTAVSMGFYEDAAKDLEQVARQSLAAHAAAIEEPALQALLAQLPNDRGIIRAETEKLALYAHGLGRAIAEDDVLALAPIEADAALDDAVVAAMRGEGAQAVEALHRSDAAGVTAIKGLERHLLRLLEAQVLIAQGVPSDKVGGKLKPPVFWKEAAAFEAQLAAWKGPRLLAALDRLRAAEIAAKTQSPTAGMIAIGVYREIAGMAPRR